MISIDATISVSHWISQYTIWKDHQNFYHNEKHLEIYNNKQGLPCYHHQDVQAINSDLSPVIVIDCVTEGIHSINNFKQYDKNKHYLIISNGWWDTTQIQLPISYDLITYYYFLFEMTDTYLSPNRFSFYQDKDYCFSLNKPCMFVSTIGVERPERNTFVKELQKNISYNNYILKYTGQNLGMLYNNDIIETSNNSFDPYSNLLDNYFITLSQTLPIDMYNLARFNLLVESDIDIDDEFFLTEKTVKTLITGMPFVVLATPNFLKHLRNIGFATYDNLWDESYDEEIRFNDRVKKIILLCNKLNNFDWNAKQEELQKIQLHNRNNFFKLNKLSHQQFSAAEHVLKKVLDESRH